MTLSLRERLRNKGCRAYSDDGRVQVSIAAGHSRRFAAMSISP